MSPQPPPGNRSVLIARSVLLADGVTLMKGRAKIMQLQLRGYGTGHIRIRRFLGPTKRGLGGPSRRLSDFLQLRPLRHAVTSFLAASGTAARRRLDGNSWYINLGSGVLSGFICLVCQMRYISHCGRGGGAAGQVESRESAQAFGEVPP